MALCDEKNAYFREGKNKYRNFRHRIQAYHGESNDKKRCLKIYLQFQMGKHQNEAKHVVFPQHKFGHCEVEQHEFL